MLTRSLRRHVNDRCAYCGCCDGAIAALWDCASIGVHDTEQRAGGEPASRDPVIRWLSKSKESRYCDPAFPHIIPALTS